jgi:hypothetical protein
MKIGAAGTLAEVSPEHFRQLATGARLSWPMARERLADLCDRVAKSCRQLESPRDAASNPGPETPGAVVLGRVERMMRLIRGRN